MPATIKSCNDFERDEPTEGQLQVKRQYPCDPHGLSLTMKMPQELFNVYNVSLSY